MVPGNLVVFPHDAHHVMANTESAPRSEQVNAPMTMDGSTDMVCGFFEFGSPAIFPVLDSLAPALLIPAAAARTQRYVAWMLEELKEERSGHYATVDQLAFLMFVEVLREQVTSGALESGLIRALFEARIGPALNLIHRSPEHAWTVDELASAAAMGKTAFAERFGNFQRKVARCVVLQPT